MNVRSMWDRVTWETFVMIKYEVDLEKQRIFW